MFCLNPNSTWFFSHLWFISLEELHKILSSSNVLKSSIDKNGNLWTLIRQKNRITYGTAQLLLKQDHKITLVLF